MTVKAAKNRLQCRGLIYLDSEENLDHPDYLGVALAPGVVEHLKHLGIDDPEE